MSLAVIGVVDFITIWSIISTSLFLSTNFVLTFDVLTLILSLYFIFFSDYIDILADSKFWAYATKICSFSITLVIRKFLWYSSSFVHFSLSCKVFSILQFVKTSPGLTSDKWLLESTSLLSIFWNNEAHLLLLPHNSSMMNSLMAGFSRLIVIIFISNISICILGSHFSSLMH